VDGGQVTGAAEVRRAPGGGEVRVHVDEGGVAEVEFARGDTNFFDYHLVQLIADTLHDLAADGRTRAVLLCSTGRHFCPGADFGTADDEMATPDGAHLYDAAERLFAQPLPVVAAVQGAAIGGGLGLALAADFRVTTPTARFAAPFARLGLTQGFGLTVTLPRLVGSQRAAEILLTARRIGGAEAVELGLADRLAEPEELRDKARELAASIAANAPLAVRSIRELLRGDLADRVRRATDQEKARQNALLGTADHAEGIAADLARRTPVYVGR
jgi:2-(1,2-epoxy-1,2-dihydrophenyl)acetyl-CoA isomerase